MCRPAEEAGNDAATALCWAASSSRRFFSCAANSAQLPMDGTAAPPAFETHGPELEL